ncbi:hypothetical protein [uncultured Dokdonia sp.]|uniref:hypothetical protein n=1 Tax=uncultured Dokdonia sp. TaxID=575653 RepID=UPI0030EBD43C|tara:strand:+ start:15478 stop:16287 length:810 start_codon:yes stop_codon:yes gene_type:complete
MKKTLFKKYEWIKDNLNLIIFVPTLLGGLWQLIELSNISSAYIRFFSITQVVPDGLLILFMISMIIGSYYFAGVIIKRTPFYGAKNKSWKSAIATSILILIVFTFSGYELYKSIKDIGYFRISDIAFIIFHFSFFFGILLHIIPHDTKINIVSKLNKKNDEKNENESDQEIPEWKYNLKLLLACGILVVCFFIIKFTFILVADLRTSYINTENLVNIENLKAAIDKKENDYSFGKILYFNDKYFFIQIKDSLNNEYIRVLKTEAMFEAK